MSRNQSRRALRRDRVSHQGRPIASGGGLDDDTMRAGGHPAAGVEGWMGRRRFGLLLGPVVLIGVIMAPLSLTRSQHILVAILAFAMTYWALEAIPVPVTCLIVLALCVVLDVPGTSGTNRGSPGQFVYGGFASTMVFLLIGGFIIAQAMVKHGLNQRIALAVLAIPGVAGSTSRVIVAFGLLGATLSSVIANGAVASMLLPIAIGIDRSLSEQIREMRPDLADRHTLRFSTSLMLMTAYGITIGGLLTPVGDPSNLIGRYFIEEQLGVRVSFGRWILLTAPIVVVLFVLLAVLLIKLNRPEVRHLPGGREVILRKRRELGPVSRGELNVLAAFLLAVFLWVLPTMVGLIWGTGTSAQLNVQDRVDPAVAALVAASVLFVMPVRWRRPEFTMTWADAARIDWGTILLIGTGLTLGRLLVSSGLAQVFGQTLAARVLGAPGWVVYLMAGSIAILISEITSNTASVGIVVPMIPAIALSSGVDPVTAALIAVFAATYGFMLPISTSSNAIAYSSGAVPIRSMMRTGLIVDLTGVVVITVGTRLMIGLVGVR
jgi:sodium-dependent dicarboxylate transporter 2/3/5